MLKLFNRLRCAFNDRIEVSGSELPLGEDEDPFTAPVRLEISDVFDLHAIPPAQVEAVVEEYLHEAHRLGFQYVRLIHGKGIGTQRRIVRTVLSRIPFVISFADAPPEAVRTFQRSNVPTF
jgi:dsDNA-specific endonuclease/ATPase MutS2